MDFTPFYYTYSTIVQTLATTFAFMTAVFLLRWPDLLANIEELTHKSDAVEKDPITIPNHEMIHTHEGFHASMVVTSLSLMLTSGTIALCFVFLPLTAVIANTFGLVVAHGFLVFTIVLALFCLLLHWSIVATMLRLRSDHLSRVGYLVAKLHAFSKRRNAPTTGP